MIGHNTTLTHCNWGARAIIIIACYCWSLCLFFLDILPFRLCIYFLVIVFCCVCVCPNVWTSNCARARCWRLCVFFRLLLIFFYLHIRFRFIIWNEIEYARLLLIFSNCFNETFSSLFYWSSENGERLSWISMRQMSSKKKGLRERNKMTTCVFMCECFSIFQ